jgi:hypothetical protein
LIFESQKNKKRMERDSSAWCGSNRLALSATWRVCVRYRPMTKKTMTAFACLPACLHFHK